MRASKPIELTGSTMVTMSVDTLIKVRRNEFRNNRPGG